MSSGWKKDLLLVGGISMVGYALYSYFTTENIETKEEKKNSETKKVEKLEKEENHELELNFIEKWVLYTNLKEVKKYHELLKLTENSTDLISLTFKGEALDLLEETNEAENIFNHIIKQYSNSDDDLYAIGRSYEQLQNYEKAIEYFEKLKSKNHPFSHYSIGIYLQNGVIFEKNPTKALEYYTISADLSNPAAQYLVALTLKKGEKSFEYLKKSADSNYLPALLTLGEILSSQQDYISAFHYYMKAAMEDHPKAQFEISTFYSNGTGVEKDYDEAFQWCKKAADNEYPPAEYLLGGLYHTGAGCEKNLSLSFDYYNRAAEKGVISAQYMLGSMLITGEFGFEDEELGMNLLEMAAKGGHEKAKKLFDEFSLSFAQTDDDDDQYETDEEE